MTTRPLTRVGHIAYGRNRFCGADVFSTLADTIVTPSELAILALGGRPLDADDREVLRCVALALTSPDPRVWPLKLTRVLAAHGNPYAGIHGAQLANSTELIGPNAATSAARAIVTIADAVSDHTDRAALDAAIANFLEPKPIIGGFGVPFREEDERLVAFQGWLADHPITQRKHWTISVALGDALRRRNDIRPNIVSALAPVALDFAIAPHRAGVFVATMLSHTFTAHALEAADQDGPILREIDVSHVDYRGKPPRRSR